MLVVGMSTIMSFLIALAIYKGIDSLDQHQQTDIRQYV